MPVCHGGKAAAGAIYHRGGRRHQYGAGRPVRGGVFAGARQVRRLATALSQFIGGSLPLVYFARPNSSLLRLGECRMDLRALLKTCSNGSSEFMSNVSMSLVSMLYNVQLMKLRRTRTVSLPTAC